MTFWRRNKHPRFSSDNSRADLINWGGKGCRGRGWEPATEWGLTFKTSNWLAGEGGQWPAGGSGQAYGTHGSTGVGKADTENCSQGVGEGGTRAAPSHTGCLLGALRCVCMCGCPSPRGLRHRGTLQSKSRYKMAVHLSKGTFGDSAAARREVSGWDRLCRSQPRLRPTPRRLMHGLGGCGYRIRASVGQQGCVRGSRGVRTANRHNCCQDPSWLYSQLQVLCDPGQVFFPLWTAAEQRGHRAFPRPGSSFLRQEGGVLAACEGEPFILTTSMASP